MKICENCGNPVDAMDWNEESDEVTEYYCADCDITYTPEQCEDKACDDCGADTMRLKPVQVEREFATPFGTRIVTLWLCGSCREKRES